MRDCKTCARSMLPDDWVVNGCTAWSCDYINKDDAITAYQDRENGITEKVVHCLNCGKSVTKGQHDDGIGYLYCTDRKSIVEHTDYCSWGIEK